MHLEPAGEQIVQKVTDDDNAGEVAYEPDEDIFTNEDRLFNWVNHQPSGSESGEGGPDKGHTLDWEVDEPLNNTEVALWESIRTKLGNLVRTGV